MQTREQDAREAIARLKAELVVINGEADRLALARRDALDRANAISQEIREWSRHIPPTVSELCYCHAGRDGNCTWVHCPQERDGEPHLSGRHCPLDRGDFEA